MTKRGLFFQGLFAVMIILSMMNAGCATFNRWIGLGDDEEVVVKPPPTNSLTGEEFVRFSDNPNTYNPPDRQYRRMTKARMEEEAQLHAQAGSMWVMEGQGAYLFAQNQVRKEGDILGVTLDGSARKQVETKVSVIKKLLAQLEEEDLKQKQQQLDLKLAQEKEANGDRAPASVAPAAAPVAAKPAAPAKEEPIEIAAIPSRIIERMGDGNYRVKGQQPFMIGKREYKVIVTGIVRPEDYNDQGISSEKLLDPQFDVVSIRRSQQ